MTVAGAMLVVGLVLVGVLGAVGLSLHRDLARIHDELAESGHQPDFGRYLVQIRQDLQNVHDAGFEAIEARLHAIETAVAEEQQRSRELGRAVRWAVAWVQYWSRTGDEGTAG